MWNNCDIPAKLFFKIIETNNLELLGKGSQKEREKAFENIFDEYYQLEQDSGMKQLLEKKQMIALLKLKITYIDNLVQIILNSYLTTDQRLRLIDKLIAIEVKFDKKKPIKEECKRIQTIVLGGLKTRLKFEEQALSELSKGKRIKYEEALTSIEDIKGRVLNEDMSLRKFIAEKKSAQEKVNKKSNGER